MLKNTPKDVYFTPVCTTEMIAFTRAHTYFKELNTELLGLSIDSNASHLAWVYDIYCKTGIQISFPIIADRNGEIARKYGMISNDISNTETVRNVYRNNKDNICISSECRRIYTRNNKNNTSTASIRM